MVGKRVMIVDTDEKFANYLKENLTLQGHSVILILNSFVGAAEIKNANFDLALVKVGLPDFPTADLIRELKKVDLDCVIIGILENSDPDAIQYVLRLGVYDFITKPINLEKLFYIVKKGVELHSLMSSQHKLIRSIEEQNASLQKQNNILAIRVDEMSKNLSRLYDNLHTTYLRTIRALAQAIDARDHYTHSHSENVSKYAVKISQAMQLPPHEIEIIRQACELHDIGKIGINDQILSKEEPLTLEEREQIKLHSLKGAQILGPLNFLEGVIELVRQHHERYDGTGYPNGQKQNEISLGARIIHLADAYDAMTSARAYRKTPLTKEEAIQEVKKNSGSQFDPKVVEAFLKIVHEL